MESLMGRKRNNKPFTFHVEMRPIVKGRPRLGRKGRVYTPERTLIAEAKIADAYKEANGPFYEGPVQVEAVFKSKGIDVTITPLDETHTSPLRGDTDNYLKLLCDALNEVAYLDDKRVMIIRGEKQ